VLCSNKTVRAKQWTDDLYRGDSVLDADALARWSTRLGTHVTCIRIVDGMHDLLLSAPDIRQRVFAEITRWTDAYAD
jgi:alpha-beta hydrolase superfamily lysophospholipase